MNRENNIKKLSELLKTKIAQKIEESIYLNDLKILYQTLIFQG